MKLTYDLSAFIGVQNSLFCKFQTPSPQPTKNHCLGPLSSKSSASPHKFLKLEFIEVLEAMAKKIACKGEGARCNFKDMYMCSKYFEEFG